MVATGVEPLLVAYVLAFGVAALVCFGSVARARRIGDPETRRGLTWLLILSGGWAASHVAFLVAPGVELKTAFYLVGLVVGLATVGPWLYFCSAYTGRTLHRNRAYRRVAVGAFVGISALKLTNPLHGQYVTSTLRSSPFPHLAVQPEPLHWIVAGLAYALTAFGGFMLFDRFRRAGADTTPLAVLVLLTGLPIGLDLLGYLSPLFIEVTYEPLGVAVFAVGTLVLYTGRFRAVLLTSDVDDPVIVLDGADRIRDFNAAAAAAFPALDSAVGRPLDSVAPPLAEGLAKASEASGGEGVGSGADDRVTDESVPPVVTVPGDGTTRYFRPTTVPVALGDPDDGRRLVLTDVTEAERKRQALERQNERLERFASAVSHDLRNPLNAASAQLDIARRKLDGENRHLAAVAEEQGRMDEMISDLLTLAREGRDIGETEPVSLAELADGCWNRVDPDGDGPELRVEGDLRFRADPDRLRQVLENLFRNSVEHGSTSPASQAQQDSVEHGDEEPGELTIRVGPLPDGHGFYVADDGPGIPEDRREKVFETGHTTADDGTGFGLAIVQEIVTAHGWEVRVGESETGGARFEISGVDIVD